MFRRSLNTSKTNSFFLFGARGTGKTTLLEKDFDAEGSLYLNLLDPDLATQLQVDPGLLRQLVARHEGRWCIVDEVQKVPALLDIVHDLIEKKGSLFALTGSSARKLKRGSANLLAGRAFVFHLFPLTHREMGESFDLDVALAYGTLPKLSELHSPRDKKLFLKAYADTYLKEEILIEQLIRNLPPFKKFLALSAYQDTEVVSYSSLARDVLVDPKIITNYYSILADTLVGFFLEPFHTSLRKRQKKSPKFYWFDTGVRRALAGHLDNEVTPQSYEYGSLFESFVVNEAHRLLNYAERSFQLSFVRIDNNIEVDLIIERAGMPTYVIEIKSTKRVNEEHCRSVKKVSQMIKGSKPLVLSLDQNRKLIDGVECLPWDLGFKEIGV